VFELDCAEHIRISSMQLYAVFMDLLETNSLVKKLQFIDYQPCYFILSLFMMYFYDVYCFHVINDFPLKSL